MMKSFFSFLFFLLFPFLVHGQAILLKEKLALADQGNYVVTEQNKTFTFLHIHTKSDTSIILEEVTVPANRLGKTFTNWREWFENGAHGNTSWTMTQVNMATGCLEEVFSFTHQGWLNTSDANSFFATLLNLSFQPVPDQHRRRIGLPPGFNKIDHRPIWNPRLIVEGKLVPNVPFTAWKARWPCDGSELSRKVIEIYLPDTAHASNQSFPLYFPYWLEVEGKIGSAKIRIVDSGTGACSPKMGLPMRPLTLAGNDPFNEDGLTFYLKGPNYYRDFLLIAEDSSSPSTAFPISCQAKVLDKETLALNISKNNLDKNLLTGRSYRFLITPTENPFLCLESKTLTY